MRRRQLGAELAAEPGLLLDLAHGTGLVALPRLALPLRERPVVVLRPVHEQEPAVAHDDPARRADYAVFASFFHADRHSSRPRSARTCSRSISRPAARAASGIRVARLTQPLGRDHCILVLAEHILKHLRRRDVGAGTGELGRVAGALHVNPHRVQLLVG